MAVDLEPLPVDAVAFRFEPWDGGSKPGRMEEAIRAEDFIYGIGNFNRAQDHEGGTEYTRSYLVRFAAEAPYALDQTWNPAPNNRLWKARYDAANSLLYVGGQFTSISGVTRTRLACYDIADPADPAINARFNGFTGPNGAVYAMALDDDGNLWVGGDFGSVGGSNRPGLARLNTGTTTVTVNATPNPTIVQAAGLNVQIYVQDMVWDDINNQMLVALRNTADVNGKVGKIFAFQKDGTINWFANPLSSNTQGFTFQVAVDDIQAYLALDGANWTYAFRLTDGVQRWTFHTDGNNQGVQTMGGNIFIGHHGDWSAAVKDSGQAHGDSSQGAGDHTPRSIGLIALDQNGVLQDWRPEFRFPPGDEFGASNLKCFRIGKDEAAGQLYVGGDFAGVYDADTDTQIHMRRLAVFNPTGGVVDPPDPGEGNVVTNSFENSAQADGASLTSGNSAYTGGDALTVTVTGTGTTAKYETDAPYDGARCARLHVPASTNSDRCTAILKQDFSIGEGADVFPEFAFRQNVRMTNEIMAGYDANDRKLWSIVRRRIGTIQLRDFNNEGIEASTMRMGLGLTTWYRVSVRALIDASDQDNNRLEVLLYSGDNTTVFETVTADGIDLGGAGGETAYVLYGRLNPGSRTADMDVDLLHIQDSGYFGQSSEPPITAQDVQELPPFGYGGMNNVAGDPNDIDVWHLLTDVGGYRRTVDSLDWDIRMKGLDNAGWRKSSALFVADDPTNPGTSLVGIGFGFNPNGYCESDDGGDFFTTRDTSSIASFNAQSPTGLPPDIDTTWLPHIPRSNPDFGYDPGRDLRYAGSFKQGLSRVNRAGTFTRIAGAPGAQGVDHWYIETVHCDPRDFTRVLVAVHAGPQNSGGLYEVTGANTGTGKNFVKLTPDSVTTVWDFCIVGNNLYAACDNDGIWMATGNFSSANWTDISGPKISKNSIWCTIDGYLNGSNHVLGVGCHDAVKVQDDGTPGSAPSGRDNRFGCVYRTLAAQGGAPTWDYVSDPGSSDFPSGGDGDVNIESPLTGRRFSQADTNNNGGNILGRTGAQVRKFRWHPASPAGGSKRAGVIGAGGAFYLSRDNATTWQVVPDGVVIASTQSVFPDRSRPNATWNTIQDLDCWVIFDLDEEFPSGQVTPNVQHYTTGYSGFGSPDGNTYLTEGDPPASQTNHGEVLHWDGVQPGVPNWTVIGGWDGTAGDDTTVNGLPDARPLAICEGRQPGGGIRTVVYLMGHGTWYRDGRAGDWVQSDMPEFDDANISAHDMVWPHGWQTNHDGVIGLVVSHGTRGGLWFSADYGVTWAKKVSNNSGELHLWAKRNQSHAWYYGGLDNLRRLRDPDTMTLDEAARDDNITTFYHPRSGDFFDNGDMAFWCEPDSTHLPQLIVVSNPPSGSDQTDWEDYVDVIDPLGPIAQDDHGQAALNRVTNIVCQGSNIVCGINGGSSVLVRL